MALTAAKKAEIKQTMGQLIDAFPLNTVDDIQSLIDGLNVLKFYANVSNGGWIQPIADYMKASPLDENHEEFVEVCQSVINGRRVSLEILTNAERAAYIAEWARQRQQQMPQSLEGYQGRSNPSASLTNTQAFHRAWQSNRDTIKGTVDREPRFSGTPSMLGLYAHRSAWIPGIVSPVYLERMTPIVQQFDYCLAMIVCAAAAVTRRQQAQQLQTLLQTRDVHAATAFDFAMYMQASIEPVWALIPWLEVGRHVRNAPIVQFGRWRRGLDNWEYPSQSTCPEMVIRQKNYTLADARFWNSITIRQLSNGEFMLVAGVLNRYTTDASIFDNNQNITADYALLRADISRETPGVLDLPGSGEHTSLFRAQGTSENIIALSERLFTAIESLEGRGGVPESLRADICTALTEAAPLLGQEEVRTPVNSL